MVTEEKKSNRDLGFNTQNPVVFLSTRTLRTEETNTKNSITRKMPGYIFCVPKRPEISVPKRNCSRMTREGRGYGPPTNSDHQ